MPECGAGGVELLAHLRQTAGRAFVLYDVTYEVAAGVKIAQDIQRRINDLLPAIIITKRNDYYIIRDTITGYRPKPFSPFAGTIFDTDVR